MKLQQNNGNNGYYQCYTFHDSDTDKHGNGGLTGQGNIKCQGDYNKTDDILRIGFKIPKDSELDANGMRLTLNTMRCQNYDPKVECWDRAYPEWALTGENFDLSRGSTMECLWKHPFTSTDRNDVTCKKGSETVAYPTAPPANIATGTIDSIKLEYSYQTKGIINEPGKPQKEGIITIDDSIYTTRNINGCQLGNSSPDSKCPPGLNCKYIKDANGVTTGVSISGNKKTQFISAAWFKGCACNADQAMPGRGICDPVMHRSIPAQSEHQMHNNFCFAPNNQETKITCMFDSNKCSVSEGSISDGTCIANPQPEPTSPPLQNSCPGKQEQAAPNACNAACCTPGMENQCPSGQSCNVSNGYCLGGHSCGPSSDNVCKAAGQTCGPIHYKEDCGNGGTRWCHKYQSTCSGVGNETMCIWNGPPNSCCDVCSDGSRDNNTCSTQGGTNPGTPPNSSPQTGQPATIRTKVKVSNVNNLDTGATHHITITYSDTADSSRKAYITKESYLLNDYSYDISIDSSYASTVPILTGHTYTLQADVTLTNGTVITSSTITSTLSASSTTVSDLNLYVSSGSGASRIDFNIAIENAVMDTHSNAQYVGFYAQDLTANQTLGDKLTVIGTRRSFDLSLPGLDSTHSYRISPRLKTENGTGGDIQRVKFILLQCGSYSNPSGKEADSCDTQPGDTVVFKVVNNGGNSGDTPSSPTTRSITLSVVYNTTGPSTLPPPGEDNVQISFCKRNGFRCDTPTLGTGHLTLNNPSQTVQIPTSYNAVYFTILSTLPNVEISGGEGYIWERLRSSERSRSVARIFDIDPNATTASFSVTVNYIPKCELSNASPSNGEAIIRNADGSNIGPVTFRWNGCTGSNRYKLSITSQCGAGYGGMHHLDIETNDTFAPANFSTCGLNQWPIRVSWNVSLLSSQNWTPRNIATSAVTSFTLAPTANSAPPPPAQTFCSASNQCLTVGADCLNVGQRYVVCTPTNVCSSGRQYLTFYRRNEGRCIQNESNGSECAPSSSPCINYDYGGVSQKNSSTAKAAVISDIDNNGTVEASDFVAAMRKFGQTVKVNGQEVKINAQYMSTLLGNLGKKVK